MSSSTSPRARAREDDERRADIAQVLELLDLARIAEIPIDRIPALLLNLTALRSKTETVETILVARLAVAAALPSSPSSGPNYRECISASEAGRRLSLPKLRIYQLAREGLLPAVRIGRQVRSDLLCQGNRRRACAESREAVSELVADRLREAAKESDVPSLWDRATTLAAYAAHWLENVLPEVVEPSTVGQYKQLLHGHVMPFTRLAETHPRRMCT